jgi:hypothetical protein
MQPRCALILAGLLLGCSSGPAPSNDGLPVGDRAPMVTDAGPDSLLPSEARGPAAIRPGIWKINIVDGMPKFKSRVALAVDPSGRPHLAYNIASSDDGWKTPDIWHAVRESGSWSLQKAVPANGVSNEYPSIVTDSKGKVHIVYNRLVKEQGQIDLFAVSAEDGKTFSAPINLTNSTDADEFAATAAVDGQGTLHVLVHREVQKAPSIAYLTVTAGQPSAIEVVATGTAVHSLNPGHHIAVDSKGTVYAVYSRPGSSNPLLSVLHLKQRTTVWSAETAVSDKAQDAWDPCLAVDGNGTLHLAYVLGKNWDEKRLTYDRFRQQSWAGAIPLSSSVEDRSYYLGLAAAPDGTVHIAFTRYFPYNSTSGRADLFYLSGKDGLFAPEQRLTSTPEQDEGTPALALGPGATPLIAFTENLSAAPDGKIYLASY